MNQLKGLWRDTKWVWGLFSAVILIMTFSISWLFLLAFTVLPVSYCYFAFIRYDEDGNEKTDF